jgi:hypothetical protein
MAKVWTTEELITEVRRIGAFNDVESEGKADADVINALDLVMMDELVPQLSILSEEYLVRDHVLTTTTNQIYVDVPSRAVANTIRDIYVSDTDDGNARYLPRINRENRPFYTQDVSDFPEGFYLSGDHIVLVPKNAGGKQLNLSYMFRPGQLVKSAAYRKVVSVDSTTSVTVDSTVPTGWSTANTFDVHSAKSGAEVRVFDYGASVVTGTTVTFSAVIDGSLDNTFAVEIGDYVCLSETAAVPSLPREMHSMLAQAAAVRLLESDGDAVGVEIGRQTLARQISSFQKLGENRVWGKPHKTVNRGSFIMRQSTRGGGW